MDKNQNYVNPTLDEAPLGARWHGGFWYYKGVCSYCKGLCNGLDKGWCPRFYVWQQEVNAWVPDYSKRKRSEGFVRLYCKLRWKNVS